jgi:hypothetical protein
MVKKIIMKWKDEICRDLIAFGSIPFYFIFVIRGAIGPLYPFLNQLLVAAGVIFVFWIFFRKHADLYMARASVLGVFSALFYKHTLFTIFVIIFWFIFLYCLIRVKKDIRKVVMGIIVGAISISTAYIAFH